ncbi:MAG: hypothetical protein HW401_908 [Parcubacteria group bacterium]|nr:hypothetical protein [Parcubacteria group bacterium]
MSKYVQVSVFVKIMKKIIFIASIMFLAAMAVLVFDIGRGDDTEPINFKECALKGYSILESYPRQCRTPDGKSFVEDVEENVIASADKSNLIKVDQPLPNEIVKSPLIVSGLARGVWFFEGSFPIRLFDDGGNEIAVGIAQAEGEWMTTEFVPFKAELKFEKPLGKTGEMILEKDNPSDLRQYDDELVIPIKFEE